MFAEMKHWFKRPDRSDTSVHRPSKKNHNGDSTGPYCSLEQLMGLKLNARSLALPKANKIARPQTGAHRSRFRGRGMEFSEVRAYQPGDDVRSIDWRVTARRQKPHTKLFNEERERPIFIICDQSQSQFFGSRCTFKSVRAAETSALFAWTALEKNDKVGGLIFSERNHRAIKPARNRKSILALLSTVCDFNHALHIGLSGIDDPEHKQSSEINRQSKTQGRDSAFTLSDAMNETLRLVKPGTLVLIISDFNHLDKETEKPLAQLAKHNELIMIRTYDPVEDTLPPPGLYPVSNGDETIVINAESNSSRSEYQKWAATKRNHLKELSQKFRAPLVDVSTYESPINSLRQMLTFLGGKS